MKKNIVISVFWVVSVVLSFYIGHKYTTNDELVQFYADGVNFGYSWGMMDAQASIDSGGSIVEFLPDGSMKKTDYSKKK